MIALLKQNFGVQTRGILGLMCKWQIEKIIRENAFEQNNKKPPGDTPYFSRIGMCYPSTSCFIMQIVMFLC